MNKKTALVTGASQGLGLALCKELISREYDVAALDIKASYELKALKSNALQIIECDIASNEAVYQAGQALQLDRLNLIINNAGIWLDRKRKKLNDSEFEFETMLMQYQVNALGAVRIVREFMPKLLMSDKKTVINISSEAGSIGACMRKSEYGYCMSKAALNMATKLMSNDYSEQGVKFYAIHPGWMITPQGLAGAVGDIRPEQRAEDSAEILVNIAEEKPKAGIYYDIQGRELNW